MFPPVNKSYAAIASSVPSVVSAHRNSAPTYTNQQPSSHTSYKKTVYINRRPASKPTKGYDQSAHQAIIDDYRIPNPQNGCALNNSSNSLIMSTSDIIQILIDTLTKSNIALPSNVAL